MPKKDQPPPEIWLNDEAIAEHFDRVTASYENPSGSDDGDAEPLQQNELTKGLRRG